MLCALGQFYSVNSLKCYELDLPCNDWMDFIVSGRLIVYFTCYFSVSVLVRAFMFSNLTLSRNHTITTADNPKNWRCGLHASKLCLHRVFGIRSLHCKWSTELGCQSSCAFLCTTTSWNLRWAATVTTVHRLLWREIGESNTILSGVRRLLQNGKRPRGFRKTFCFVNPLVHSIHVHSNRNIEIVVLPVNIFV